jgi:hypothetical protein
MRILRDDKSQMICTILNGELMYEGTFESFPGHQNLGDILRSLGYSVTEEGYTYD